MKILFFFLLPFCFLPAFSFAFDPPSAFDRSEALGPLDNEPAILRRLFTPDVDFAPIRVPEIGDWLSLHDEPGQPYGAYVSSGFNRPNSARKIIYLLPLGNFPQGKSPPLEDLRAYAEAFFQLSVKILPAAAIDERKFKPRTNENTRQLQLHTLSILQHLKTQLPSDAYCLLGITMEDLYVFGQASLAERVGIYSFARYDPAFFSQDRSVDYRQIILKRSCKVLAHETAHMFGLHHCIYFDCLMNGANNLAESDSHPQHLCPVCLRKLHYNVQFNPVTRYEELNKFYKTHDWDDETLWTERQLKKIKPDHP
ncbi:MAG: archaemetzincin [Nibricoccus sp.]